MSERAGPDPFTPVRGLSRERNTNPRQTLNILEAGRFRAPFKKRRDAGKMLGIRFLSAPDYRLALSARPGLNFIATPLMQ